MALTLLAAGAHRAEENIWREEPPLPLAIAGHASAWRDGTLWIAGGSFWENGAKRVANTLWRAHRGASWETVASLPGGGFAHGGSAASANTLWLAGGLDNALHASATLRRIDLATGAVTMLHSLPAPRVYCGAALLNDSLWVVGGTPVDGEFAASPTTWWQLDPATGNVRATGNDGPATINPLVLALDGAVHVLPGSVWSATERRLVAPRELWIFSSTDRRWRTRRLPQPLPRGLSGIALDEHRALLVGGVEPTATGGAAALSARTWLYDARASTIEPRPSLPAPRLAASLALATDRVLVIGGESGPRERAATTWSRPISVPGNHSPAPR